MYARSIQDPDGHIWEFMWMDPDHGADPDELRSSVLATMVPDGRPVPAWPREVPPGTVGRLAARLPGHRTRT